MKTFRDFWQFNQSSEELKNQCSILKISLPFTEEELKKVFRAASQVTHPDRGGSDEEFRAVKNAYDYLKPYASHELTEEEVEALNWKRIEIEELEPFKNFADCEECGGKGRWVEEQDVVEGAGWGIVSCPKCGGDGKYKLPCRACGGTGRFVQRNSQREVACRKCSGTGLFTIGECFHCVGTGSVPGLVYTTSDRKTIQRECWTCNGTGRREILNPVIKKGVISRGR